MIQPFESYNNKGIEILEIKDFGDVRIVPYHATVTWVDFPQKNKDRYEYRNWKYSDDSGNLINENELFN